MDSKFDVVKVEIDSGRVADIIASGVRERQAEGIVNMAVMRQGVAKYFFSPVSAGRFKIGDQYKPGE
jgi:hypothetical protein